MVAKLRTQACEVELIKKRASLYRIKAELCEMLLPITNYDALTEPEWQALQEIYGSTQELLDQLDGISAKIEAIKP